MTVQKLNLLRRLRSEGAAALVLCCYFAAVSGATLLLHVHSAEHGCGGAKQHDSQKCQLCKSFALTAKGCTSAVCGGVCQADLVSCFASIQEPLVLHSRPPGPVAARGPPVQHA